MTQYLMRSVATSVEEESDDDSNTGTDVNGWSGDYGGPEVRGYASGIVLIRSLGRRKQFENLKRHVNFLQRYKSDAFHVRDIDLKSMSRLLGKPNFVSTVIHKTSVHCTEIG
jgi:hypothetical protein